MKKIGEGRVSVGYSMDKNTVLLVGKHAAAFGLYQNMRDDLNFLADKITALEIPKSLSLIAPCPEYPLGAHLISKIPGAELSTRLESLTLEQKSAIGAKLGDFARQLHSINANINRAQTIEIEKSKLADALSILKTKVNKHEYEKLTLVCQQYTQILETGPIVLAHGDLIPPQIFVDENNNAIGVADINLEHNIPEIDFATIQRVDETMLRAMLVAYGMPIRTDKLRLVFAVKMIRGFLRMYLSGNKADAARKLGQIRAYISAPW